MGCRSLYFICVIFSLFFSSIAQSLQNQSARISLDDLLQQYASRVLARSHSGILYKATLPANLSGMEASVVRLRGGSFWTRGANYSAFQLPPKISASPYIKRLAIVYQNLGNWSSHYYRVSGHSLVTPVVGFRAYDASNFSSSVITPINLSVIGDPISIHFPQFLLPSGLNWTAKCVTFNVDGTVFLTDMTLPNVCSTPNQGHFSIVVEQPKRKARRGWNLWRWWVVVVVCGFVGLVSICVVSILLVRHTKAKKIRKMERKADQGESFKTIWVGSSKMPSAAVTRTQPILENSYAP
ncbi:uncharacterized protein LOC122664028 [Telopea speciosissima]|uniref:uncharacterized protein LOC122664028 n=1 Tax=Telopea speciosissima TaxID=54955 RepID=UPI001CC3A6CF|nr:uncharacterized protein LOC122664028 [Telopea speciosissima]